MKSMIVYASHHHGNTEKLVKHLANQYEITLINAEELSQITYEGYDLIGFASGIDFGKFYPAVTALAETLPAGKLIYALFTCAKDNGKYSDEIQKIAEKTGCTYLGKYGCKGYNTYGPWKLIGGMNKSHPDQEELTKACSFYEQTQKMASSFLEKAE